MEATIQNQSKEQPQNATSPHGEDQRLKDERIVNSAQSAEKRMDEVRRDLERLLREQRLNGRVSQSTIRSISEEVAKVESSKSGATEKTVRVTTEDFRTEQQKVLGKSPFAGGLAAGVIGNMREEMRGLNTSVGSAIKEIEAAVYLSPEDARVLNELRLMSKQLKEIDHELTEHTALRIAAGSEEKVEHNEARSSVSHRAKAA